MNLADFRTDRNGNPYGLKKCKYHCDYGDGEYCHYKEIDGCIYNKTKEEIDGSGRKVGDDMQSAIDAFEKQHSAPQIFKDRLGRYVFEPVRIGLKDCCGFVYRIFARSVK